MNVLIVGLNPSPSNTDPKVPFVGTKSHKTLIEWQDTVFTREDNIYYTNLVTDKVTSKSELIKSDDIQRNFERFLLEIKNINPDVVVGLGSRSHTVLLQNYQVIRLNCNPVILYWPHPSPRNRNLNNKTATKEWLIRQHSNINVLRYTRLLRTFT